MTLPELCIKRPVFTWVLVSIPAVLGIVCYGSLGVALFPKVDFPVCAVIASFPGASVEEVETSLAKPLEEAVNSVSGIQELETTVTEGSAVVVVQFTLEKNGDLGAQEVRDKISSLLPSLPDGVKMPVVEKFNIDAAPVLTLAVSGSRDTREITEICRRKLQEPLLGLDSVGNVFVGGGLVRAINIVLDPDQLAARKIAADDVRKLIASQNQEIPGGLVQQGTRELVLRTMARVEQVSRFRDLNLGTRNGTSVKLGDVATIEDSVEEPRSVSRLDGRQAVSIYVQKQSGGNTVRAVDDVMRRLEKLKESLPADLRVEVIQDQSKFVRGSIKEVQFHLLLAAALVSATILLFIRDWRTTVVATLAIPTSVVPTFLCMKLMGFTLDNISMLALILAVGIVIDDAVVVHENIFRRMEELGEDAWTASRRGAREIGLAVVATSLSLIVIFLPIAFMGGIVGRFFSSFGVTVAFAVASSLFVSFTLTPMLCSRFLKLDPGHGAASKGGFLWQLVERTYLGLLGWCLRHRFVTLLFAFGVFCATYPIFTNLGANLVPRDDQSEFRVAMTCPEGYTLARADAAVKVVEARLRTLPHVTTLYANIGQGGRAAKGQGDVTKASVYVRLDPLEARTLTQFQIMDQARAALKGFPELRIAVMDVDAIAGGGGEDARLFQMNIKGPDLGKLAEYSQLMLRKLREAKADDGRPGFTDLDTTLALRKPELQIAIDRDRAADLGVPIDSIGDTLGLLVGGKIVSRFKEGSEQYDVWLRAALPFRDNPQLLGTLLVPGRAGPIPLASVATAREALGPSEIHRYKRQRTVKLVGNPEGLSLQACVERGKAIAKEVGLPPEYELQFLGQADTLDETFFYFAVAFGLSLLFMYMILAAQFESWLDPFAIMASLPITIPFGLLSLMLFGQPLDLYAMFGLFMLVGIVKKNGILQVDAANQLQTQGMPRDAAILEANKLRLRPILMTTMMLVAAMAPLALGRGPGAGARASMAKIIIGGQALSLILALVMTPVMQSTLDGLRRRCGFRGRAAFHPDDPESLGATPAIPEKPAGGTKFRGR